MATANTSIDSKSDDKSKPKEAEVFPEWVNEENFIEIFKANFEGFEKILNFEAQNTGGGGENCASTMIRVKIEYQVDDSSSKNVAFLIKTVPQGGKLSEMIVKMGLFPREAKMYPYLREFEQMYHDSGKHITLAPKSFRFQKDPGNDYILLEDLSPAGFKNINRLEGLDREHTESALKILSELHAASAVRYETKGRYDECIMTGMYTESNRKDLEGMMNPAQKSMIETMSKYKHGDKFIQKLKNFFENQVDDFIQLSLPNDHDFSVINHGDLWSNNIIFLNDQEGRPELALFVDFQMSKYTTPAFDLYYLLFSSTSLDVKLSLFDDFVQFYFDHLVENLKLLKYAKPIPTLKQLHMDLLKYSKWGLSTVTGLMAGVLRDPNENPELENMFEEDKAAGLVREVYGNPRYVKHIEAILPWMDARGLLD